MKVGSESDAGESAASKRAMDAFAWSLNIFTSVAIVMVNKQLMGDAGYGFSFATTLCGLHFLCTSSIGLFRDFLRVPHERYVRLRCHLIKGSTCLPARNLKKNWNRRISTRERWGSI